jgi:hypothetical protein
VGDPAADRLNELCRVAEGAAKARGHELGQWQARRGEEERERRSVCSRCGRVAYVRLGGGMTGVAGAALMERCGDEVRPVAG